MFNARFETVAEKSAFKATYMRSRCLIPASVYYEWQKLDQSNKQPFWIGRKDNEPFAMAGLYEDWTDTETGELVESCTIITQDAHEKMAHIHDRMPVMLLDKFHNDWLDCDLVGFPSMAFE